MEYSLKKLKVNYILIKPGEKKKETKREQQNIQGKVNTKKKKNP